MSLSTNTEVSPILPHHEQQALCSTRLPYRQGRRLTAVKVYTINDESKHLLIFGVPALNLRQEAKAMFARFGKLLQFNLTKHPGEQFTDTYHALFERIQSARIAKKMLDTKNYYGGILHICYAPELENVCEMKEKIIHRQKDVLYRLQNLKKEFKNVNLNVTNEVFRNVDESFGKEIVNECVNNLELDNAVKLYMGENNLIITGNKGKRNKQAVVIEKKFKPTFFIEKKLEIIDCTSTDQSTVTNINDSLNYNNFGNEVIRKIAEKPVNTIKFNLGNKNS